MGQNDLKMANIVKIARSLGGGEVKVAATMWHCHWKLGSPWMGSHLFRKEAMLICRQSGT